MLPRPLRPPPMALPMLLMAFDEFVEVALLAAFVTLLAVLLAVGLNGAPGVPWPERVVVLPAFDILPAVVLPAFDILPATVLFIMLPEEVMLLDFVAELLLALPARVAPSTDEAEPALASIMPIDRTRPTPKMWDAIFAIGCSEHT